MGREVSFVGVSAHQALVFPSSQPSRYLFPFFAASDLCTPAEWRWFDDHENFEATIQVETLYLRSRIGVHVRFDSCNTGVPSERVTIFAVVPNQSSEGHS